MPTFYQLTIAGQPEFSPPAYNLWTFLDHIAQTRPKLLDRSHHGELVHAFAHWLGLEPDRWSKDMGPILWLMKVSPDIERACRKYRADAY